MSFGHAKSNDMKCITTWDLSLGCQDLRPTPSPIHLGNSFYGAGSGLITGGLGAYGGKILGSSSEYVQSNISRYFSDPQYYFQVNDHYVRNKLKVVLFPFLHRGHWMRITEPVGGRLSYKPPIYDINAPDLYIPFMAFGTYVVLAGLSLGLNGKFSPEALNWLFVKGLLGWFMQVALLKMIFLSLGSGEAPFVRHCCICWVYFHRRVFCCPWKDPTWILLLHFDAMFLLMHGNFLGEDDEESTFCRGEEL
ncbi:INTEGRAL MEMBRANE HRF1 FAMILY PROTEIN [Salix purpurea]|uniref:INTEGRAL MEMBRANE HRF1 FAMILY PROTEIN n=1 Tax=Salix purpurea TaxID=77065 RepID=A0A9Q0ZH25_SALPP|nr:INTEGRAL MEMBRANE HRF1 FAMILY PROTEIN [Salix purpurea]